MPDLVTHTFSVYFFGLHPRSRRFRWIFYLRAFLPDLISRPLYILWPMWASYSVAMHTPLFVAIFCVLMAELFDAPLRSPVRLALWAGSGLHFLLDSFQRHIGAGYNWLFPFSWRRFEFAWFWPESSLVLVPVWITILAVVETSLWMRDRARDSGHG